MAKSLAPRFFKTPAAFRAWLEKHHLTADEIVVGYYRKSSRKVSITWQESVDEALCFGWIDGIRRKYGEDCYGSRFTPRRPNSNWSTININRVAVLTRLKRMRPAGLAAFARRKTARSGIYTYEQTDVATLDKAIEKTFRANKKAWKFFQAQAPYYRKLMTRWINSGKAEETRLRRLAKLMASCEQGRRL